MIVQINRKELMTLNITENVTEVKVKFRKSTVKHKTGKKIITQGENKNLIKETKEETHTYIKIVILSIN